MNRRPNGRTLFGHIVLVALGGIGGILGAVLGLFLSLYVYGTGCALFMNEIQRADPSGSLGGLLVLIAIPVGIVGLLMGSILGAGLGTYIGSRLTGGARPTRRDTTTAGVAVTNTPFDAPSARGRTALGGFLGAAVGVILTCGGWILIWFPTSEPLTEAERYYDLVRIILTIVGVIVLGPLGAVVGAVLGTRLTTRLRRKDSQRPIPASCPFAETERPDHGGQD